MAGFFTAGERFDVARRLAAPVGLRFFVNQLSDSGLVLSHETYTVTGIQRASGERRHADDDVMLPHPPVRS